MKILYISYTKDDCFITGYDVKKYVDLRSLKDIFDDNDKYLFDEFDICFIHPKSPTDPGYKLAKIETVIFSNDYTKFKIPKQTSDKTLHIYKDKLFDIYNELLFIFDKTKNIKDTVNKINSTKTSLLEKVKVSDKMIKQYDRHKIANHEGARIFFQIITKHNSFSHFSEEFKSKLIKYLINLENTYNMPDTTERLGFKITSNGNLLKGKRVLLIDDEHSRGWSAVWASLLFDGPSDIIDISSKEDAYNIKPGLYTIDRVGDTDAPNDLDHLKKLLDINSNKSKVLPFDLLLLDYRIKGEDPAYVKTHDVSGTKVIKLIQKIDPSLPVIIVTASQNYKTLRYLNLFGILGYYAKPFSFPDNNQEIYKEVCEDEFNGLLEMIDFSKRNIYWRDFWETVIWLESGNAKIRNIYITREMHKHYTESFQNKNIRVLFKEDLSKLYSDAIRFLFRQRRNYMYSETFAEEKEVEQIYSIDTFRWAIYQLSHIGGIIWDAPESHKIINGLGEKDPIYFFSFNIAKKLRNIVSHTDSFMPQESTLFIMSLTLQIFIFKSELPQNCLLRTSHKYKPEQIYSFKDIYHLYYKNTDINEPEILKKLEEIASNKSTNKDVIYSSYLLLYYHLEKKLNKSTQEYLLMYLIQFEIIHN